MLVQTGFDGNNKLPAVLRNGLSDINVWLWQILQAEVSGEAVPAQSLCGMNAEAIRLVSHDPMKYLGQGHIVRRGSRPERRAAQLAARPGPRS